MILLIECDSLNSLISNFITFFSPAIIFPYVFASNVLPTPVLPENRNDKHLFLL